MQNEAATTPSNPAPSKPVSGSNTGRSPFGPVAAFIGALLAQVLVILSPASAQPFQWNNIERVVAIGDLHGDYDAYIELLEAAGLLGEDGRSWTGGRTHLVQLGDVVDRGGQGFKSSIILCS